MMVASPRATRILRDLHELRAEQDISNQPTVRVDRVRGSWPITAPLPPLAFYRSEQTNALMKIARAVEQFVCEQGEPKQVGVAASVLREYWRLLYLQVYYARRADGSHYPVRIVQMNLPPDVVYVTQ